jgi:3-hydroxyacyl-CoA dehydrogenase
MGFRPFSGGPFRMINKIGIDNFIKTLENNRRQFGERYNPTNLLYQYKDKSKSFY